MIYCSKQLEEHHEEDNEEQLVEVSDEARGVVMCGGEAGVWVWS